MESFHDTPCNSLNQQDDSTCCLTLKNQLDLEREGTKKMEASIYVSRKLGPHLSSHRALGRMVRTLSFHNNIVVLTRLAADSLDEVVDILTQLEGLDVGGNPNFKMSTVARLINVDKYLQLEHQLRCRCYKNTFSPLPPMLRSVCPGNTKGGSITIPLTSCLTGLD
jgi:hypothetical protein